MAKYYGAVGYAVSTEVRPGIWKDTIVERMYYGDVIRNNRRLESSEKINDDVNISNEISILADPYANENFHLIKYVEFMGTKWKVSNITVQFPRLILSVGGVYNGQQTNSADDI